MSTHKYIDTICISIITASLFIASLLVKVGAAGASDSSRLLGYENRLFDTSYIHSLEIVMEDWESFLENCENEEYTSCAVVIDGEAYRNIGIRAKGNTSLSAVSALGSNRYSFKLEFDHYDSSKSYYGLDKLSLNNIIQDNTYMKDYLVYQMMGDFGVDAPLCSYIFIMVNGEDWGLYLAVEGVEEAFLQRNYGKDYGKLYKPDSMNLGGGRGVGGAFEGGGMGSLDVRLQYIDDDLESYPGIFDNAKTDITKADQIRLVEALEALGNHTDIEKVVNVEEVIRYFVVHNFVCNEDSYTGTMVHNYYLYEENGTLSMIPWDYNLAFGTFQASDSTKIINTPIDSPVSSGDNSDRPMLHWIFEEEGYTEQYHQYFADFITNTDFVGLIKETVALIAPYVEKDPGKFCTYEEFEKGAAAIEDFCLLRAESVRKQLEGTIPSTLEGQSAATESFIDASELVLSEMGTMENGMGKAPREMIPAGNFSEEQNSMTPEPPSNVMDSSENKDFPNEGNMPENGKIPEDFIGGFSEKGNIPKENWFEDNRPKEAGSDTQGASSLLLSAVSVVSLAAGLGIAFRYKRW